MTTDLFIRLGSLLSFALLANIPLGYLRETAPKFSVRWFVLIHLSIPFLVALRFHLDFDWSVVPLSIAFAVAGQFIGGYLRRRGAPR